MIPPEMTGSAWGQGLVPWKQPQRGASGALGAQERELQLLESCEQKAAASPGLRWWKRFPREQRGTCKTVATQRVFSSDVKKSERKICSVRRKGLEELVTRLHHSCSILPNPLKCFMYVYMSVYLSSWVLQVLFSKTLLVLNWGAWGEGTGTAALKFQLI